MFWALEVSCIDVAVLRRLDDPGLVGVVSVVPVADVGEDQGQLGKVVGKRDHLSGQTVQATAVG